MRIGNILPSILRQFKEKLKQNSDLLLICLPWLILTLSLNSGPSSFPFTLREKKRIKNYHFANKNSHYILNGKKLSLCVNSAVSFMNNRHWQNIPFTGYPPDIQRTEYVVGGERRPLRTDCGERLVIDRSKGFFKIWHKRAELTTTSQKRMLKTDLRKVKGSYYFSLGRTTFPNLTIVKTIFNLP